LVDVEGEGPEAKFTFAGTPKTTLPDVVPAEVTGGGGEEPAV
jgi:ATP-dependent Clp protease ATP-binding subunit ClpC